MDPNRRFSFSFISFISSAASPTVPKFCTPLSCSSLVGQKTSPTSIDSGGLVTRLSCSEGAALTLLAPSSQCSIPPSDGLTSSSSLDFLLHRAYPRSMSSLSLLCSGDHPSLEILKPSPARLQRLRKFPLLVLDGFTRPVASIVRRAILSGTLVKQRCLFQLRSPNAGNVP
jgi:hypothetical protein